MARSKPFVAFEVFLNGRRICIAGVTGRGALSAIATWVKRVAHEPNTGDPIAAKFEEELTLAQ